MEFAKNPLLVWLRRAYNYALSHKKEFFIGILLVITLIFLFIGYGYYKSRIQRKAHKSFVKALKYFNMPIRKDEESKELDFNKSFFASEKEKWIKVEKVFAKGYQDNKRAGIASMFLVYQSEALLNLGKIIQAIDILKKALGIMDKSSVSYSYYNVKLALMHIDSNEKELKEKGIESLKQIVLDQNSPAHDMVLYRLGEYFWHEKNFDETRNYWNQLILKYGKTAKKPSWWVELAKPKLKLISSK
ncbi:hypothetical protein KAT08_02560 [Candidatus Babeliales bacterium]|nr:hypothetical protein [Candidatus Babeliales bacterium]